MHRLTRGATLLAASALAAGGAFGIANAQTKSGPAAAVSVSEIVVTGSRIRTSPLDQDQPVISIDQAAVAKTGLTSTVEVLQRIPSAGGGLNSKFNNSGNLGNPPDGGGVGAGSAEIDLRYLSSRRVLVLVDGMRWVSGASASGVPGAVDLNTIPTAMISRMEVLQEGASPIYGSDAIAGVVNIITKRSQDGFQASAQAGKFGNGDGFSQDYNFSWGLSQDHTHVVFGGGYFKQDPVFSGSRAISRFPNPYQTSCLGGGCSSGTPLGRLIVHDPNTNQDLNITLKQALQPGQRPIYVPGDPTGAAGSYKAFTTADRFDFQPYNYIETPLERTSAFLSVTQDLTDSIRFHGRASYVERKSANQAAPLPLFVGPDAGNGNLLDTVAVDRTNPYNPFGFTLTDGTYSFIGRRLIEAGPRHYEQTVDTVNLTATLEGDLPVGARTWHWDANAVWSRNHADQTFTGNVNAQRVQQALGPLAGCTGACVPLNLFGGAGTITPAMLSYIGFTQVDSSQQDLRDYSANLTGDLIDLPAGPLAFAVGVEHRQTSGYFQPDPIVAAGLSSDIPAQPARGSITVKEGYGELKIPILKDQPFFYRLEASVAGRWFDYSTSGSDSTYKAGVNWRPVHDVLVRGSWGQGFRAPSIGELFGSASRFDQVITDPCSGFLTNGSSAAVRANCIARGVPANGSYTQLNSQIPVTTSGNRGLKPETSDGRNYSIVWQPEALREASWASGGSIEVAYSEINLDGAIQALDGQTVLNRCANTNDVLSCATITRTASGAIAAIANPLINIGGIKTRAVDLNILWSSPEWSLGRFTLSSNTTFLLEFAERQPTDTGFASVERKGTERGSPDQAYPKTKSNLSLDWQQGQWGATGTARYISAVEETQQPNRLDARTYFDAQLRWTPPMWDSQFRIAAGVNNLFDKDPPGCFSCSLNNFDPNAYDVPGRFFYLRLSYRQ
ncbi:TonB-dependent receptor domain-containing protein [Phenylobacterium sp.]|uniref:TonB-dependent receptor domain-containing protein n=1 Tax=Phenylobacterium sp. TaxID=1871053 RepID=UPI00374DA9A7